jgi:hypothetical protein
MPVIDCVSYNSFNDHVVLSKICTELPLKNRDGSIYKISTHQFRHTVATEIIDAGVDIYAVKEFLGHSAVAMTEKYIKVYQQRLKKEFKEKLGRSDSTDIKDKIPEQDEFYDNKWTMDIMYEMMKTVAHPAGDGVMDVENGDDTWGMVGIAFDTYQLVLGGGDAQVTKDADDLPRFAMADEANVNTFSKVFDIVTDKSTVAFKESYYSWDSTEGAKVCDHFYNGMALFLPGTINAVSEDKMRNADIHYGILPMPKYDENQEKYASTINPYQFFVLAIPTNNTEDLDKITFCLEAMAYLGSQSVKAAYYDMTLKLKRFSDDDDSPAMLDILFSNRIVDISIIFNWSDCIQYYNNLFFANDNKITSYCESHKGAFDAAMQETIDAYQKLSALDG